MRRTRATYWGVLAAGGLFVAMASVGAHAAGSDPGRTSPYAIASRCEPLAGALAGSPCEGVIEEVCVTLPACWWRDTTAQNRITESAESQYLGEVVPAYESTAVSVWVYSSREGPNVIAVVAGTQYLLVGAGASDNVRDAARAAFTATIPGFSELTLGGILYTRVGKGLYGSIWTTDPNVPIYVNANWVNERQAWMMVTAAVDGLFSQWSGQGLTWGTDALLGTGVAYGWDTTAPTGYGAPNVALSSTSTTSLVFNGVTLYFMPALSVDENHALLLPYQRLLILGGPFGPYFPDMAPLDRKPLTSVYLIRWINSWINANPSVLVLQHGLPIIGSSNVMSALTAWRDAVSYVHSETVRRMNAGEDIDTIAATLALQEPLASNAWVQPLTTTIDGAVRSVHAQTLGWYSGRPAALASRGMTPAAESSRLVAGFGGPVATLAQAREALTEHSTDGTRWAVRLADAVIQTDPPEALVTAAYCLYSAALRKVALSAKSAPERNLLLTEVAAADLGELCTTDTDGDGTPDWLDPDDLPCQGAEVCDGVDNDCNGEVDDGLPASPPECDDGDPCTGVETCQAGQCTPGEPLLHSGDVDGNQVLSSGDALLAFQIALGGQQPTAAESCAADCNGDGVVSSGDASQIFQVSLGMTTCSESLPTRAGAR